MSFVLALAAPASALAAIDVSLGPGATPLQIAVTDPSSDIVLDAADAATIVVDATAPITVAAGGGCTLDATGMIATCIVGGIPSVQYTGGDGADRLRTASPFAQPITADGGLGDDSLTGGDGSDTLTGDAGSDTIDGGAGNDSLDTSDGGVDASISCGDGADKLFADNFLDPLDLAGCETIAPEFGPGDPSIMAADPVVGATLTASAAPSGTASTLQWQWFGCDAAGGSCVPFTDELGPTITLLPEDAGTTLRVGARADNAAGFDQNISAPSGVVRALPVAPPPAVTLPAPVTRRTTPVAPRALTGRVTRTRCGGRTCRLTLVLRGPVSRVRVDLRRGSTRLARVDRRARAGTIVVTIRAKRRLTRGTYTLAVRLTAADGRTRSFRRSVRFR